MSTSLPVYQNQPRYKIVVKDKSNNLLGEFETFRNLTFAKKLNNYGTCSFEVPVNDSKTASLIALRLYLVEIYRNDVRFWVGEQANRVGKLDENGDNWITLTCFTFLEQLNSRYTANEVIFTYQDATQIVKSLIDTTQADTDGDLGITYGTMPATTWREKTYTNQNIMDAIIALANLDDGFDFTLSDNKVLTIANFIGIDRTASLILEYGKNIKKMTISEDFSKPATRAIVLGNTGVAGDSIRVERDSVSEEGNYGLREYVYNQMEVSGVSALSTTGDSVLAKYGIPVLTVSLDIVRGESPTLSDFALGDILRLIVKNGSYNIDETFRVFEWSVKFNTDNTETLVLTLSNYRISF